MLVYCRSFQVFSITLIMIDKIKQSYYKYKNRVKNKIKSTSTYVKISRIGHRVADRILVALLAFFNVAGPIWNFLFVKKPKPDKKPGSRYTIKMSNIIPNPFTDDDNKPGPTDTKSQSLKF